MFKYILLLNALLISAVAAYYSILGLVVIFAASALPVIVMASTLEVGKIMTATYLHNYWKETGWILKTYLTAAVAVLMLITSLGIFGFLSKAHIEQGLDGKQVAQQIEQIDRQISRLEADAQASIDRANALVDNRRTQVNSEIESLSSQVRAAQRNLDALSQTQQIGDVRALQTIVGVEVDGRFGPNTELAVQSFRLRQETTINELNGRIEDLNTRLQAEIDNVSTLDVTEQVQTLTQQRFDLERQVTQIEAEVGPIKYVAEVIYGESDTDLLEQAVRWMIIIIVLVFDPLAIALLLAFNTLHKKEKLNVQVVNKPIEKERNKTRATTKSSDEESRENSKEAEETESKKVVEEQVQTVSEPAPVIETPTIKPPKKNLKTSIKRRGSAAAERKGLRKQ